MQLRPLRRNERDLVVGFFNGLSADSRYQRFLQPMPRLPEAYLRQLVDVDGCRHVAVVAIVDGECVGMARYIALPDEPGAAEVEVTVTDRYQGRGIGELLVTTCLDRARAARKRRVVISTGSRMTAAQRLYERLGFVRLPERDWTPAPGIDLLVYARDL